MSLSNSEISDTSQPNNNQIISILYVDDEEVLLNLTKIFMEQSGEFRVDTALSAKEALNSPLIQSYDAIVSDYQMPVMDGIAFLKVVRERFGDIPFILFTGRGREEIVIEAINNGADFYLQKGGKPQAQFAELGHKIRQAVKRKKAEQELRRSEERYRSVINDQTEMIARFTPDGTVTFTNEAYHSYLSPLLGLDTIVGKKIHEIIQIPNYDIVEQFLHSLTVKSPVQEMEWEITDGNNQKLWQNWTVRALFDRDNTLSEYQVVGRDITETKQALAAVAESESRLRSFIETTSEAVSLCDEEGKIIEWNASSERLTGIPKKEALGMFIWDLTFRLTRREKQTEEKRRTIEQALQTSLVTGVPVFTKPHIFEAQRPDGSRIFSRQTIFPIKTGKGFRFGSISHDITQEKHIEDKLRESEDRFRGMAERSSDLIFVLGTGMSPTYVSPSARLIIGYEPEELVGKPPEFAAATIFSQSGPDLMNAVQATMRGEIVENVEIQISKKDNVPVFVNLYAVPIIQNGIVTGAQVSMRDITAAKKAESALKESEERFRGMAERSSDLVFIINDRMGCTYVSPSVKTILGFEPEELIEKPLEFAASTIFSQSGPELMDAINATRRGESVQNVEFQISKKDGTLVFVNVYAVPMIQDGMVTGVQVSMRDITAAKKAEIALKEIEGKFRRFAHNAHDILFRMSLPDRIFEYISPASESLTGYSPEEFYSDPGLFTRIIYPSWKESNQELWDTEIRKNLPKTLEYQIIGKFGEIHWFNQRNVLVADEQGELVALEGIVTDITRQKQIEHELRRSEQRFLAVSNNVGSWVWEINPDGMFIYSSPAVFDILGYSTDEVIGKLHFCDFFDESVHKELKEYVYTAFGSHEPFSNFVNLNRHRNGTQVILKTSGIPVFDEKGVFIGYCGINEDITGQKRMEDALRMTNRQLNLLTGITRHDIINKTSIIHGYLGVMEADITDPVLSEYIEIMKNTTDEIQYEIEFTRIYEDLGSHAPRWIKLDTVLPFSFLPSHITLISDLQDICIFADPMLEKVFFNLLDNSVRHGQQVTEIKVSARPSGNDLIVVWEDNGVGIIDEEKERIFEQGFGKNTGLGMFLVREILSLTRISIIENGIAGQGARFEIQVPYGMWRLCTDNNA